MSDELLVITEPDPSTREAAMALRYRVFVQEQQVPLSLERDDFDAPGSGARHVVVMAGPVAVATGRVRLVDDAAKVERVAVDAKRRGTGLGRQVMAALEDAGRDLGAARVKLAAQQSAIAFYKRLGYVAFGDPFMDAGIVHRWMERTLDAQRAPDQ